MVNHRKLLKITPFLVKNNTTPIKQNPLVRGVLGHQKGPPRVGPGSAPKLRQNPYKMAEIMTPPNFSKMAGDDL